MALRLRGATSGYIELKAPASAGDNTLTLPVNNGSANQILKTDGSGNLSWVDDANTQLTFANDSNNRIITGTGSGLNAEANLTFDGSDLTVGSGKLTVTGSTSDTSVFTGNGISVIHASGSNVFIGTQTGTDAKIAVTNNAALHFRTNNIERLRITSGGEINTTDDLQIGTQANHTKELRFADSSRVDASSIHVDNSTADLLITNDRGTGSIRLATNSAERMRVTSAGNVGLGTTSPTTKLDVNGTVKATDYVGDYPLSNRRININGDMKIAQRNTSKASITSNGYHFVDRWSWMQNGGTVTLSQVSADVPSGAGFKYSAKMQTTTASGGSIAAGNVLGYGYAFEGQDIHRLKYGNAAAESLAISFWAKSSQTGVFVTTLKHGSRIVSEQHTISNANTWVKYTWIVPGDTSTALTNTDNTEGMRLYIYISSGSNTNGGAHISTWGSYHSAHMAAGNTLDCLTNVNATFYLTGVQVEIGEVVTPYEHISYDEEFRKCQRYYQDWTEWTSPASNHGDDHYDGHAIVQQLRVDMRANPTISQDTHGWLINESSWTDGSNGNAASWHHDPTSFAGRYVKVTGRYNWNAGYNNTTGIKAVYAYFDAEL